VNPACMIAKTNKLLDSAMPVITPLGVIFGFVLTEQLRPHKDFVTYLFSFITFTGGLTLSFDEFKAALKRPLVIINVILCSHFLIAGVSALIASVVFAGRHDIVSAYVLLMAIPTAVTSYIWCSVYNGNTSVSLTIILLDTILSPLITPLVVRLFSGRNVVIDTNGMIISLVFMVVLPSIAGALVSKFTKQRYNKNVVPTGRALSKIALMGVIAINTSQIAGGFVLSRQIIHIVILTFCLTFLAFATGFFLARLLKTGRKTQVAITFALGMHNISASMVLSIKFLPPDSVIPAIAGIILQQTVAALSGLLFFRKDVKC